MTKTTSKPDHDIHEARPQADLVLFDGQCEFCRRQVDRLAKCDGRGRVAFVSLHDPRVQRWFPDLDHDELMQHMYLVDLTGRRHAGAAALRYLSRRIPRLWLLAPLLHIPGSLGLWQWLYRRVARRRYARCGNSCDTATCDVHFK